METAITDLSQKVKGFWSRPEGTTGMILMFALGVATFFTVGPYMGLVATILEDTMTAMWFAAGCLATGWFLTRPRLWSLLSGAFRVISRSLTNIFVTIYPIEILEEYVDKLAKKKQNIKDQIKKLNGVITNLDQTIQTNEKDRAAALSMAKAARDTGKNAQFVLSAKKSGRLKESNMTLSQLLAKLQALMRVLRKMSEVTDFMFEDIQENVRVQKMQKTAMDAGVSAMRSVMSFIADTSDDKKLYDQAMEFLITDYGNKLGEIDEFMNVATPFIEGVDLRNMAFQADALADLENWEKNADNLLLGDEKQLLLADGDLSQLFSTDVREQVPVSSREPASVRKYVSKKAAATN